MILTLSPTMHSLFSSCALNFLENPEALVVNRVLFEGLRLNDNGFIHLVADDDTRSDFTVCLSIQESVLLTDFLFQLKSSLPGQFLS